jgi:hypothetical protein
MSIEDGNDQNLRKAMFLKTCVCDNDSESFRVSRIWCWDIILSSMFLRVEIGDAGA